MRSRKQARWLLHLMATGWVVGLGLGLGACGSKEGSGSRPLDPAMARVVAEKKAQAKELAAGATNPVPREVWKFFDLVERNQWQRATNVFEGLRRQSGAYANPVPPGGFRGLLSQLFAGRGAPPAPALQEALWCPVHEVLGIGESFQDWDRQLLYRFGRDIIGSIPTNSIYFGGTDPGRFVITALCESHRKGKPFYTLTQNALADGRYLDYLRQMYGGEIYIPTVTDSQTAFSNYLNDAQQRLQAGRLRPGEDVRVVGNRVQVSGQVAVMEINALLVKVIVDHNPDQEVYIEESFPLEWMYRHLSPHGLILRLNRAPLPELEEAITRKDHEYWRQYAGRLVGNWIGEETSVKEVGDFAERVYLKKDLEGFTGDRAFARNVAAQKAFSKLRSAIGGIYAWRYSHAATAVEKERMGKEADYAFRQALALCPYSPEAVFRYVNFLLSEKRLQDALVVAQTCQRLDPKNTQVAQLVEQVRKLQ